MRKPRSRLKGQKSQGWVEGVLGDGAGGVSGEDLGEGAHWGTGGPSLTPKLEGPSLGATPPPPPPPRAFWRRRCGRGAISGCEWWSAEEAWGGLSTSQGAPQRGLVPAFVGGRDRHWARAGRGPGRWLAGA